LVGFSPLAGVPAGATSLALVTVAPEVSGLALVALEDSALDVAGLDEAGLDEADDADAVVVSAAGFVWLPQAASARMATAPRANRIFM
jgi:hypothetical protein